MQITNNVTAMTGSEKQIAWAQDIKQREMESLDSLCNLFYVGRELSKRGLGDVEFAKLGMVTPQDAQDFCDSVKNRVVEMLDDRTSAKWWIDNGVAAVLRARQLVLDEMSI